MPLAFPYLLFNEINYVGFKFHIIQPVYAGNTPGADAIDLYQFVSQYIDTNKIESVFNQPVFDGGTDFSLLCGYIMFIAPA